MQNLLDDSSNLDCSCNRVSVLEFFIIYIMDLLLFRPLLLHVIMAFCYSNGLHKYWEWEFPVEE